MNDGFIRESTTARGRNGTAEPLGILIAIDGGRVTYLPATCWWRRASDTRERQPANVGQIQAPVDGDDALRWGGELDGILILLRESKARLLVELRDAEDQSAWAVLELFLERDGYQAVTTDPADRRSFLYRRVRATGRATSGSPPVRFTLVPTGGPEPGTVVRAVREILATVEDGSSRAALHTQARRMLTWLFAGVGTYTLETGPLGEKPPTVWLDPPVAGVEELTRHLLDCRAAESGPACETCESLAVAVEQQLARDVTGVKYRTTRELLDLARLRSGMLGDIEALFATSTVSRDQRRAAYERLRRLPPGMALTLASAILGRWPLELANHTGEAPWSLLVWCWRGKDDHRRVSLRGITESGWTEEMAGDVCGLYVNTLGNEGSPDGMVLAAALALAEMAPRRGNAIQRRMILRLLALRQRARAPHARDLIDHTAYLFCNHYIEARATVHTRRPPRARGVDALQIWECLKALPPKTRQTRNCWLRAFAELPALREIMMVEARDLDPDPVLSGAWEWPMPPTPRDVYDELLSRRDEADDVELAELALARSWASALTRGEHTAPPPIPCAADGTVRGHPGYWKTYLWGCRRVGGEPGREMWNELLCEAQQVLDGKLDASAENQLWFSLRSYGERPDAQWPPGWTEIACERLDGLLARTETSGADRRLVSLIRVIAGHLQDGSRLADLWVRSLARARAAGGATAQQHHLTALGVRGDLGDILRRSDMRREIERCALARGQRAKYLITGAVRLMARAAGFADRLDRLINATLHRDMWTSDMRPWIGEILASRASDWRIHFGNLLERVATGRIAGAVHGTDVQARVFAIRELAAEDEARAVQAATEALRAGDRHVVWFWLRRVGHWADAHRDVLDEYLRVYREGEAAEAERAAQLLLRAVGRGVIAPQGAWTDITTAALERLVNPEDEPTRIRLLNTLGLNPEPDPRRWSAPALNAMTDFLRSFEPSRGGPALGLPRGVGSYLSAAGQREPQPHDPSLNLAAWVDREIQDVLSADPGDGFRKVADSLLALAPEGSDAHWRALLVVLGTLDASPPEPYLAAIRTLGEHLADEVGSGKDPYVVLIDALASIRELSGEDHPLMRAIEKLSRQALGDVILDRRILGQSIAPKQSLLDALRARPELSGAALVPLWRGLELARLDNMLDAADHVVHSFKRLDTMEIAAHLRGLDHGVGDFLEPTPDVYDRPADDVEDAVREFLDQIHSNGTRVAVEGIQSGRAEESFFAMSDVLLAVRNLVDNALRWGRPPVRILIYDDHLQVRNLPGDGADEVDWNMVSEYLSGYDMRLGTSGVRPGRGFKTLQQVVRRNRRLSMRAWWDRGEIVFALTWGTG